MLNDSTDNPRVPRPLARSLPRHGVALAALLAAVLWAPAAGFAQGGGENNVKSLDQMMDEVGREMGEDLEGADESEAKDGAKAGSGDKKVKSLDQMMGEVSEETGMEMPETEAETGEESAEEPKSLADLEADEGGEQATESSEGSGGATWFALGLVALLLVLIVAGAPLYLIIGAAAAYLLIYGEPQTGFHELTILIEETRGLADEPVLLAIPFFVLAGAIMTEGDIAQRLIDIAEAVFGKVPGGLAISTVFACAIFAAISGSSPVTVIAIGTIMYPVLVDDGYPEDFSTGLVTSAGSLGILIPPSIPMIVYGIVDPTGLRDPEGYNVVGSDGGVADLFIAGVGPGILIGVVMAIYAIFVGARADVATSDFSKAELWRAIKRGIWALFLPVLILGGIYTGMFTPTQAAAVSVVYAAVVEFFIHESMSIDDVPDVLLESATLMGTILIIMALALGFNQYLVEAKIPTEAAQAITAMDLGIIEFLLILNVLLLVVGFFMDILSAILILVPLLARIGFELGIHPVHLAIIFIVNLEIGYLTPPIGINLFVAGAMFDKGLGEVVRSVIPFMLLMLSCLMVVTYVPTVSLGLVSLSKGNGFIVGFPDTDKAAPEDPGDGSGAASPSSPSQSDNPGGETGGEEPKKKQEGVKSMDQLMQEVEEEQNGASPPGSSNSDEAKRNGDDPDRVKSMDELMQEVEEETSGSP